jgi:hypothetical protein
LIALKSFEVQPPWWEESLIIPELLAFEEDVLGVLDRAREAVEVPDQEQK